MANDVDIRQTGVVAARELTANEATQLIRPVDQIGLGLVTGTPRTLLTELSTRSDFENLTVSGGLILGYYDLFTQPGVHYRCSFLGGGERAAKAAGADIQFIPSFFRHYGLLIEQMNPRVMMTQGAVPDRDGYVSMSLYNGAHLEEFRRAGRDPNRLLIVEVSPHFPRTKALEGHRNEIHVDEIDVMVVTDAHPTALPEEGGTPEDAAIAEFAASYVTDGSTLQTGIGAVPNLVAKALVHRDGGDYGVHSEMFTDGLFQLVRAGKVTNARKRLHPGTSVTTFALGSPELYEFLNDNEDVGFAPAFYTNDPAVIAKNTKMVSINSALEVDLHGQIIADTLGARQYSGVGGHMDFLEGTSLSLEHTSLICLQSTAIVQGERISRIIGTMTPHSVVTSPRHLAGVIVTEYGCADLRGLSVSERADAMIAIAHPDFRDELRAAANRLGR